MFAKNLSEGCRKPQIVLQCEAIVLQLNDSKL